MTNSTQMTETTTMQPTTPTDEEVTTTASEIVEARVEPGVVSAGAGSEQILVDRATIEQLQNHLMYVYDRFPTRRLKQGLQITRHLLRNRGRRIG
ncbi:MAG TPA: hypothetical protein PKA05_16985 [Roseiflexaceae bacterium]|nr:hypothetical protein [Roseiflexaceae bacterium]HMP42076.1 hypothetical protein [Roseiflexaceae bacterium]